MAINQGYKPTLKMAQLQKQVLFKVLQEISKGGAGGAAAPSKKYLDALEEIGYIDQSWDTKLTKWGWEILRGFQARQWP